MSQEWTPPDDKTIARMRAMMMSDIEEGESMEKLVDELVSEDGWPRESAVNFVDYVRESVDHRRWRRAPLLLLAASGGGFIGGFVMAFLGVSPSSTLIPIGTALAAVALVRLTFRD